MLGQMYMDVLKLQQWYDGRQGRLVRRLLQNSLRSFWPNMAGETVLLLGFGVPYAHTWLHLKDVRLVCAMPARMGVVPFPDGGAGGNKSVLVWEDALPFPDSFFDKILLIHTLEYTDRAEETLAECCRTLRPDGQLLTVVANRTGLWCRAESSPFGRGQPYSAGQLEKLMQQEDLLLARLTHSLFVPPSNRRWVYDFARTIERFGQRWCPMLGGVVLAVAQKDMYTFKTVRVRAKAAPTTERMATPRVATTFRFWR